MRTPSRAIALLVSILLSAGALQAQSEQGNITGVVTDPTRAVVPGAEVTIVNTGTNVKSTVTTIGGEYNVPLAPGTYQVQVSLPGFKRHQADNVVVSAATSVRLDVRLELGAVTETVEVSPELARLQTENAKISTAVQNRLVDELPLVVAGAMRSPFDLVTITSESKGRGSALSLGGGQACRRSRPHAPSINEFTVDTNGFKAEYGQAGGGVMTFASKRS